MINYILGESRLTIVLPNKPPITVPRTDEERVKRIMNLIQQNSVEELNDELFPAKKITRISNGEIIFDGTHVKWIGNDEPMPEVLGERILDFDEKGFPIKALVNFWKNLLSNPSRTARYELYGFIEHNDMAITDDGYIIAYKKVTSKNGQPVPEKMYGWYIDSSNIVRYANGQPASADDMRLFADYVASAKILLVDSWTGKFDNSIGAKPTMPREDVDPDRNTTCSRGLHVANYDYAQSYGGDTLIMVKVSPADFVAIPNDYNNQKARVSDYEVIGFAEPKEPKNNLYKPGFGEKCEGCGYFVEECKCSSIDNNYNLLRNLEEEPEIEEEEEQENENPFSQFDIAIFYGDEDDFDLTYEGSYTVRDVSGNEILIVDDEGEEQWIDYGDFSQ